MRKSVTIRGIQRAVILITAVLTLTSCRHGADPAIEAAAPETTAPAADANAVSSLPENHEAYTAAVQNLGQTTGTSTATLYFIKPGSGQTFRRGTRIQIEAQSQQRRELRNVIFFVNGRRIGASSSNPYRTSWWAKDRGRFVITAEATQRGGKRTASSISINVE
jgi:hypothetical protein